MNLPHATSAFCVSENEYISELTKDLTSSLSSFFGSLVSPVVEHFLNVGQICHIANAGANVLQCGLTSA